MRKRTIFRANFKSRKLTVQEYLDFSKTVLRALQPLHPIFENLCGWGFSADAWHCFDKNLTDFDKVVFNQINDREIAYINSDKNNKEMHLDSYSHTGLSNSYSNTKKAKDGKVSINICDGEGEGVGFININFPQVGYEEFYTYDFCKRLIDTLEKLTNADYIGIIPDILDNNVDQVDDEFSIGWLTYFSNKEVLKHLPKNKDMMQHFPSKGAFFSIETNTPFDMGAKEIEIAQEIKDALENSSILKDYYNQF